MVLKDPSTPAQVRGQSCYDCSNWQLLKWYKGQGSSAQVLTSCSGVNGSKRCSSSLANELQQSQTHGLCCDNKNINTLHKIPVNKACELLHCNRLGVSFFNTIRPWLVVWLIHLNPIMITYRNVRVAVAVDIHCQSTVTEGKPYTQQSILRLSYRQNTPFPQFMDWLRNTTNRIR